MVAAVSQVNPCVQASVQFPATWSDRVYDEDSVPCPPLCVLDGNHGKGCDCLPDTRFSG